MKVVSDMPEESPKRLREEAIRVAMVLETQVDPPSNLLLLIMRNLLQYLRRERYQEPRMDVGMKLVETAPHNGVALRIRFTEDGNAWQANVTALYEREYNTLHGLEEARHWPPEYQGRGNQRPIMVPVALAPQIREMAKKLAWEDHYRQQEKDEE